MSMQVTVGSMTSHGGIFMVSTQNLSSIDGAMVIVDGDFVWCPKCQKGTYARANNTLSYIEDKAIVLNGDKTTCGASIIAKYTYAFSERVGGAIPVTIFDEEGNESIEMVERFAGKGMAMHPETAQPMPNIRYTYEADGILHAEEHFITDYQGLTHLIQAEDPSTVQIHFDYDNVDED